MHEGRCVKEFPGTDNLNNLNTSIIMGNITQQIETRVKIIYSFKVDIHRGASEIIGYSKTLLSPPHMFTSLKKIQAYIEECEQKRLDLENQEVWTKVFLPHERTTEARDNYEGKLIFRYI